MIVVFCCYFAFFTKRKAQKYQILTNEVLSDLFDLEESSDFESNNFGFWKLVNKHMLNTLFFLFKTLLRY